MQQYTRSAYPLPGKVACLVIMKNPDTYLYYFPFILKVSQGVRIVLEGAVWQVAALLKLQRSYRCAIQKDEFYIKDRHIYRAEHQYMLIPIQVPVFVTLVFPGRSTLALFILAVLYSSNICSISLTTSSV